MDDSMQLVKFFLFIVPETLCLRMRKLQEENMAENQHA
jgi:hypothetical protein